MVAELPELVKESAGLFCRVDAVAVGIPPLQVLRQIALEIAVDESPVRPEGVAVGADRIARRGPLWRGRGRVGAGWRR